MGMMLVECEERKDKFDVPVERLSISSYDPMEERLWSANGLSDCARVQQVSVAATKQGDPHAHL